MAFLKINDVLVDTDKVATISVKSEVYETNVMVNNVAVARCVNVTELDLERKDRDALAMAEQIARKINELKGYKGQIETMTLMQPEKTTEEELAEEKHEEARQARMKARQEKEKEKARHTYYGPF